MYCTHGYTSVGSAVIATVAKVGHPGPCSVVSDLRQNENNDVTSKWYLGTRPLSRTVRGERALILYLGTAQSNYKLDSRGYGRGSVREVADMWKRFSPSQESKPGRPSYRKLPC